MIKLTVSIHFLKYIVCIIVFNYNVQYVNIHCTTYMIRKYNFMEVKFTAAHNLIFDGRGCPKQSFCQLIPTRIKLIILLPRNHYIKKYSINRTFYFSDKYMYDMIKRDIFDSYTDVVDSLFNKCNISERIGNTPIRVSTATLTIQF